MRMTRIEVVHGFLVTGRIQQNTTVSRLKLLHGIQILGKETGGIICDLILLYFHTDDFLEITDPMVEVIEGLYGT